MNRKLTIAALFCAMLALTACGGDKKKAEEEAAAAAATEEVAQVEVYTPAVHEDGIYYVG